MYYTRVSNFNSNDKIRISIVIQNIYKVSSDSFISIEGSLEDNTVGDGNCELTNNTHEYIWTNSIWNE